MRSIVADDVELLVADLPTVPRAGWSFEWVDRASGVALLRHGHERELVAVHGQARDWAVTLRGRVIPVGVRTHRDRLLAETAEATARSVGPAEVRASLPGLVVRVAVALGDTVAVGDPLVTVEAMKMQNEIRAPRAGSVTAIEVEPGQTISGGALLVRLAERDP
jgi:biotin carboxyl carrier protein